MFVIAHIECDYLKETKLLEPNLKIGLRIARLGKKSFDFEYLLTSQTENNEAVIHAFGKSTQVLIDLKQGKSIEIPTWLREDIESYEGLV